MTGPLGAQSAEGADVRGLPECCAGEGYPGVAHDLLVARTERDQALRHVASLTAGSDYSKLVRYARQDGLHQWHREFVQTLKYERPTLLAALGYLLAEHEACPNRVDADHDEWCRTCWPVVWLRQQVGS